MISLMRLPLFCDIYDLGLGEIVVFWICRLKTGYKRRTEKPTIRFFPTSQLANFYPRISMTRVFFTDSFLFGRIIRERFAEANHGAGYHTANCHI